MHLSRILAFIGKLFLGALLAGLLALALLFAYVSLCLPSVESLKTVSLEAPLSIFTQDGKLIAEFGDIRRIPVAFKDIPQPLIDAVLSTEDQHFYEHPGVDFLGLARAAVVLVSTGQKSQGGSTITMQVARNFFLSNKKTFARKFNEILLALKIDHDLGKQAIIELYFNKVFLGEHAYGFGAAAQVYYGKPLNQLTLAEYAMLAGLPKAPSSANPIVNPKKARERRHHVLSRMLEGGFITKEEFKEADQAPVTEKYHGLTVSVSAPYVAEMIRNQLYEKYGDAIYNQGLNVYTTIDSRLQPAANSALQTGLAAYNNRHPNAAGNVEGAIVAINPKSGAILAMTGGVDFDKSRFNRVTQAHRQVGSSIKPFIYAAALSHGATLATVVNDSPFVIDDGSGKIWRPENDDHKFHGPVRVRESLVDSLNLASIRILQQAGIPYTIDYLQKFGFDPKQLPPSLSLALGTADLSPLQLASSFSVFANGGYLLSPYLIQSITNDRHQILYQTPVVKLCESNEDVLDQTIGQYTCATQTVDPQIVYLLNSAMFDVAQRGTGKKSRILNRQDLAGKTGTSNDQNDGWFSGFNQNIVTVVWVGYDTPKSLGEFGSGAALPIWIDFMQTALNGMPEAAPKRPEGIVSVRIDPQTGLRVASSHSPSLFEIFSSGTEPAMENATENTPLEQNNLQKKTETSANDLY